MYYINQRRVAAKVSEYKQIESQITIPPKIATDSDSKSVQDNIETLREFNSNVMQVIVKREDFTQIVKAEYRDIGHERRIKVLQQLHQRYGEILLEECKKRDALLQQKEDIRREIREKEIREKEIREKQRSEENIVLISTNKITKDNKQNKRKKRVSDRSTDLEIAHSEALIRVYEDAIKILSTYESPFESILQFIIACTFKSDCLGYDCGCQSKYSKIQNQLCDVVLNIMAFEKVSLEGKVEVDHLEFYTEMFYEIFRIVDPYVFNLSLDSTRKDLFPIQYAGYGISELEYLKVMKWRIDRSIELSEDVSELIDNYKTYIPNFLDRYNHDETKHVKVLIQLYKNGIVGKLTSQKLRIMDAIATFDLVRSYIADYVITGNHEYCQHQCFIVHEFIELEGKMKGKDIEINRFLRFYFTTEELIIICNHLCIDPII
jgi:hypothetical protein